LPDRFWRRIVYDDVLKRIPVITLGLAIAGMVWFSRGFGLVDTVALLACGFTAGASLAGLAAARQKAR